MDSSQAETKPYRLRCPTEWTCFPAPCASGAQVYNLLQLIIWPSTQKHTPTAKDVDMDANKIQGPADDVDESPPTEPYSLREWFYDLTDVDGESLIYAIYPSADSNKVYVLCEKQRAIKTLQVLHNLVDLVSLEFPDEALLVYFGTNKQNPSVHNYPRATPQSTAYSSHLANFATQGNPQDTIQNAVIHQSQENTRNSKRNRDSTPLHATSTTPQSYAGAVGGTSTSVPTDVFGTDMNDVLTRLNNNLNTLENFGKKQEKHDEAWNLVELRVKQVENRLTTHGQAIKSLATTQERQGKLMHTLNIKMDRMTTLLTGAPLEQPITQEDDADNTTEASNPLHGAPGVWNHECILTGPFWE